MVNFSPIVEFFGTPCICLNLSFTCQYRQGSRAGKMDSELLFRLLPNEYEYKINNIKILARSNILKGQNLKANFVVNICDKALILWR